MISQVPCERHVHDILCILRHVSLWPWFGSYVFVSYYDLVVLSIHGMIIIGRIEWVEWYKQEIWDNTLWCEYLHVIHLWKSKDIMPLHITVFIMHAWLHSITTSSDDAHVCRRRYFGSNPTGSPNHFLGRVRCSKTGVKSTGLQTSYTPCHADIARYEGVDCFMVSRE